MTGCCCRGRRGGCDSCCRRRSCGGCCTGQCGSGGGRACGWTVQWFTHGGHNPLLEVVIHLAWPHADSCLTQSACLQAEVTISHASELASLHVMYPALVVRAAFPDVGKRTTVVEAAGIGCLYLVG